MYKHFTIVSICLFLAGFAANAQVSSVQQKEQEDILHILLQSSDWNDRFYAKVMLALSDPDQGTNALASILLRNELEAELHEQMTARKRNSSYASISYHASCVIAAVDAAGVEHPGIRLILAEYYYGSVDQAVELDDNAQIFKAIHKLVGVQQLPKPCLAIDSLEYLNDHQCCRVKYSNPCGGTFETTLHLVSAGNIRIWLPVKHRVVGIR